MVHTSVFKARSSTDYIPFNYRKRKLDSNWNKRQILNDDQDETELFKDIPFTEKELEDDYDEEEFMDKLSTYLEQKYGDNDDIDYFDDNHNHNKDDKASSNQLSPFEILTMKEEELNEIMPINI